MHKRPESENGKKGKKADTQAGEPSRKTGRYTTSSEENEKALASELKIIRDNSSWFRICKYLVRIPNSNLKKNCLEIAKESESAGRPGRHAIRIAPRLYFQKETTGVDSLVKIYGGVYTFDELLSGGTAHTVVGEKMTLTSKT